MEHVSSSLAEHETKKIDTIKTRQVKTFIIILQIKKTDQIITAKNTFSNNIVT
jgi:hypothetical protein